jgi:ribosomal-protein-alanine N-acetyltransferase
MPGAVFLEGEKINLRTVEEEDIEFLRENINNPEVRVHLTARKPVNLNQEKEFFEEVISSDDNVHLAISREEEMIGIISLEENEKDIRVAEIGIWIDPEHHENGYGTESVELITNYGFNELNYHRIMARAHGENKGSQRIWEKLGFEKEGELREQVYREGDFTDAYLYGILEQEWSN